MERKLTITNATPTSNADIALDVTHRGESAPTRITLGAGESKDITVGVAVQLNAKPVVKVDESQLDALLAMEMSEEVRTAISALFPTNGNGDNSY